MFIKKKHLLKKYVLIKHISNKTYSVYHLTINKIIILLKYFLGPIFMTMTQVTTGGNWRNQRSIELPEKN